MRPNFREGSVRSFLITGFLFFFLSPIVKAAVGRASALVVISSSVAVPAVQPFLEEHIERFAVDPIYI